MCAWLKIFKNKIDKVYVKTIAVGALKPPCLPGGGVAYDFSWIAACWFAVRSSFNSDTISDYLYICLNMPVLSQFDRRPAVKKWLPENGDRRCNRTGSGPQHSYFKGIFPEAEEAIEEYVGEWTQFCLVLLRSKLIANFGK